MQIQLNILFQINICPTAFPLAITHRKYLSPLNHRPLTHSHLTWMVVPILNQAPAHRGERRRGSQPAECLPHRTRIWLLPTTRMASWENPPTKQARGPWQWCTFVLKALRWHLPLAVPLSRVPQSTWDPAPSIIRILSPHSTSLIIIHCQQLICICSWSKSVQSLFVVLFVSGEGGNKYKYPNVQGKVLLCSCRVGGRGWI